MSGAGGRDGIFAKNPWCDTGAYQGPVQETSLAAPCLNLRPFGSKCWRRKCEETCDILKKKRATYLGLFVPLSDSALVALCLPCPPRQTLVWHFATKCAAVKFAEPWLSNHFSELRDPSYVGSAMCAECLTKKLARHALLVKPMEKWPRGRQRSRWGGYICNFA